MATENVSADFLEGSLANVVEHESLKWIFVGGKGGVGKTTCSCCLSLALAAKGNQKVLLISTDPAHNLSDAFKQKFSRDPQPVNGVSNLWAMEVDPTLPEFSEDDENPMPNSVNSGLGSDGGDGFSMGKVFSDLMAAVPGIDEAMSFAEVLRLVSGMDYDVVVFDTAPTGHTLRLIQLPSVLDKGLEKILSLQGAFGGIFQAVSSIFGGQGPQLGDMLGKLEEMKKAVEDVNKQFQNPSLTTFVSVAIPEFLSLYETERLIQELTKFGIDCRNIIVNQVLVPRSDADRASELLQARMKMQQKYLMQFEELYEMDFHLIKLPLLKEEIRGVQDLRRLSVSLLDPNSLDSAWRLMELDKSGV